MAFLKNIFKKKDAPIQSYEDFWNWFQSNEKEFHKAINRHTNIEKDFLDIVSPKLHEINDGFLILTGMYNDTTAELIITVDGAVKDIVFAEELINSAPAINGWKFTALKPALKKEDVSIAMEGYEFTSENLSFYAKDNLKYPDEIDVVVFHNDLTEENRKIITSGIYIFLDNYLGELDFTTTIDTLEIKLKAEAEKELIPIEKLKDFLNWRQKEFIEKYEGVRYNTEEDQHSILEASLKSGNKLIAVVNTELLSWDSKASHPWICILVFKYDGSNNNGMPTNTDYQLLNTIEDEIMNELKDLDGYLNVGRETSNNERELYFACRDFRKPSKIFSKIKNKYSGNFEIESEVFKDKYWQVFEKFSNNQ